MYMSICSNCKKEFKKYVSIEYPNPTESTYELGSLIRNAIGLDNCKICLTKKLKIEEIKQQIEKYDQQIRSLTRSRKYYKDIRDDVNKTLLSLEWEYFNASNEDILENLQE
jgi:hypothetical protein